MAVEIINEKEHLTTQGLLKIVSIRASMNNGLTEVLKKAFPDVISVERPLVELPEKIDPHWLVGFTDGEGCFIVQIKDTLLNKKGYVQLKFVLTQSSRDTQLMHKIVNIMGIGSLSIDSRRSIVFIYISRLSDICEKLGLPHSKIQQQGVYIFTCLSTNQKYVGSSSQLALRLRGYLNQTHKSIGKLIPAPPLGPGRPPPPPPPPPPRGGGGGGGGGGDGVKNCLYNLKYITPPPPGARASTPPGPPAAPRGGV